MNDKAACSAAYEQDSPRRDRCGDGIRSTATPRSGLATSSDRRCFRNLSHIVRAKAQVVKLVDQRCYDLAVLPLAAAERGETFLTSQSERFLGCEFAASRPRFRCSRLPTPSPCRS